MKRLWFAACAATLCAGAQASSILSPVGALSNDFGEVTPLADAMNQSGLSAGFTSGVTDFDTYLAGNPTHAFPFAGNEWFGNAGVNSGSLVLDLGAVYLLDRMALWNEDGAGIDTMTVTTSTVSDFSSSMGGGSFSPLDTTLNSDYGAEVFTLAGGTRAARYVRLDLTGPNPEDSIYDGVSAGEFAFSVNVVPEPTTMAALGLGAAFLTRRRRK